MMHATLSSNKVPLTLSTDYRSRRRLGRMTKMNEIAPNNIDYDNDGWQLLSWIVSHLRSNFLFMSLNDDPDRDTSSLEEIAKQFEIVEYDPGQIIVEQGTFLYEYCDVFA